MDFIGVGKTLSGVVNKVADKFFVDAADKERFKMEYLKLEQDGQFRDQENQLKVILAEAKSKDPWTSRARPSFLYVMYILILASIPMGILTVFSPEAAEQIAEGMKAWLGSVPSELWTVFGAGYLGYTGARSFFDKKGLK